MYQDYVVMDMEMTGLSAYRDKIIEIGAVKVRQGKVTETFDTLLNPNTEISEKIREITGITNEMVKGKPYREEILKDFLLFIGNDMLIGHNLKFDYAFLKQSAYECGESWWKEKHYGVDTLKIARKMMPQDCSKRLEDLCRQYGIETDNHHRALDDAVMTEKLYRRLCQEYETETVHFYCEELGFKPKKDRRPSGRELERVEKLQRTLVRLSQGRSHLEERLSSNIQILESPDSFLRKDIYRMSQSELSRYADYLQIVINSSVNSGSSIRDTED